jgi:hypothetical protein
MMGREGHSSPRLVIRDPSLFYREIEGSRCIVDAGVALVQGESMSRRGAFGFCPGTGKQERVNGQVRSCKRKKRKGAPGVEDACGATTEHDICFPHATQLWSLAQGVHVGVGDPLGAMSHLRPITNQKIMIASK